MKVKTYLKGKNMALYFCTKSETGCWYIGQTLSPAFVTMLKSVVEVQADGDELEFIKESFTNIPFSVRNHIIWKGEFARFIAENLPT